jgi:hypothetical protein
MIAVSVTMIWAISFSAGRSSMEGLEVGEWVVDFSSKSKGLKTRW